MMGTGFRAKLESLQFTVAPHQPRTSTSPDVRHVETVDDAGVTSGFTTHHKSGRVDVEVFCDPITVRGVQ